MIEHDTDLPMPDLTVWRDLLRALQVAILFLMLVVLVGMAGHLRDIAARPIPTAQPTQDQSTIGGTLVPYGLHCTEDSVISYVANDQLGCVHLEGATIEP